MENVMTKGFSELSENEEIAINGGLGGLFFVSICGVAGILGLGVVCWSEGQKAFNAEYDSIQAVREYERQCI